MVVYTNPRLKLDAQQFESLRVWLQQHEPELSKHADLIDQLLIGEQKLSVAAKSSSMTGSQANAFKRKIRTLVGKLFISGQLRWLPEQVERAAYFLSKHPDFRHIVPHLGEDLSPYLAKALQQDLVAYLWRQSPTSFMTELEFEELKLYRLGFDPIHVNMAKRVLLDGEPQAVVAVDYGIQQNSLSDMLTRFVFGKTGGKPAKTGKVYWKPVLRSIPEDDLRAFVSSATKGKKLIDGVMDVVVNNIGVTRAAEIHGVTQGNLSAKLKALAAQALEAGLVSATQNSPDFLTPSSNGGAEQEHRRTPGKPVMWSDTPLNAAQFDRAVASFSRIIEPAWVDLLRQVLVDLQLPDQVVARLQGRTGIKPQALRSRARNLYRHALQSGILSQTQD